MARTLIVGTRKGVFVLGRHGKEWRIDRAELLGDPVTMVLGTPDGALQVAQDLGHFGVKIKLNAVRDVVAGRRVVVVDDVLTAGRATERTIDVLKEVGCTVIKVIALVDRKEGGRQYLEGLGYTVESLFTVEDLLKA